MTQAPELIYLLEADVFNPATSAVEQIYACTGSGYTTGPLDIAANRVYEPRLSLPADIRRYVFDDGKTGGASVTDLGTVRLRNVDRHYDYLHEQDYGLDGRDARVLIGYSTWPRSRFTTLMVGTMEAIEFIFRQDGEEGYESHAELRFVDPITLFDKLAAAAKFAGTNSGPTGIEGTVDDLMGAVKPRTWGTVNNVSCPMVNTSKLICMVNDGPTGGIPTVYDNAVALINDGDLTTLSALQSWTPVSGHYKTCLALGLFRLGANPAGTITADVVQVGNISTGAGGEAVTFDGTGHVVYRGSLSNLTGDAAGLLFSGWFRIDGGNGTTRTLFAGHNGISGGYFGVRMWLDTSNRINVEVRDFYGTSSMTWRSTGGYSAGSTWLHVCWDAYLFTPSASMNNSLYVNGVSVGTSLTKVGGGGKIDITLAQWSVAGKYVPGGGYSETAAISVAELWLDDSWVNLNVSPSYLTLFRTSDGYPADLGAAGQNPFGTSPSIYLRGGPSTFQTNFGTGGPWGQTGGSLVTADSSPYRPATVVSSVAVNVGEIARDIVRNITGLADSSFDYQRIARFEADAPQGVGIYVDDERNVREVLDDIFNSVAGWYAFSREKKFIAGKLQLPLDEPVLNIVQADILTIELLQTGDDGRGVPAYSITVDYARNYTVQEDGIGSTTPERRAWLAQEYRKAPPAFDNAILGAHPRALDIPFVTLMASAADAAAFAIDRFAVYSRRRPRFRIQIKLTPETAAVELGDTVDVTFDRFGLQRGARFMVLGVAYLTENDRLELDLWGGEPLPPTDGLMVWLRGDYITQTDGRVSAMRDKTGRSNDWTNPDPTNRPSPIAADPDINNQAAVSFDSTDWLQSASAITFTSDQAKTLYVVARPTGFRLNNATLYLNAALVHDISGIGTFGIYMRSAAPQMIGLVNDGGVKSVTKAAPAGDWLAAEFLQDGVGIELRTDSTPVGSRATAGAADTLFSWAIGLNTSTALDADVAEIIAYDKTLSQVERERVRAYIKARYAIGFDADGPPVGPRMWLRGDSVTEAAGAVSFWTDKTGLGRNFEQATGGSKPTYHATDSDINDQPCVEFDGSADHMTAVANFNLGKLVSQTTFTFYAVLKLDTAGANEGIFSVDGIFGLLAGVSSNKLIFEHDDGSADTVNVPVTTSVWTIVEVWHDGGMLHMRSLDQDEVAVASASTSNMAALPTIGRKSSAYFDGRIAEIIIYDAALSEADRQATRDYLATRYDLSWTVFPKLGAALLAGTGGMNVEASVILLAPYTGTAAWYRSDDMNGSATNLGVVPFYLDISAINDRSGSGLHLIAGTYLATAVAGGTVDPGFGYPEILGDDVGAGASRIAAATTAYISAAAYTIYGVIKVPAASRYGDTILEIGSDDGAANNGAIQIYIDTTTNPMTLVARDMANEARVAIPGVDTWFAFEAVKTGGVLRLATTAGAYNWIAAGSTTTTNPAFTLGFRLKTGTFRFQGSIAEVVTYTTALSAVNQATSRRYITDRYGLAWAEEPIAVLPGRGSVAATGRVAAVATAVLAGEGGLVARPQTIWPGEVSMTGRGRALVGTGNVLPAATGWWAADRASLSGGAFDFWRDKSGNSRDLRQTSAGLRPLPLDSVAAIAGQPAADFPLIPDGLGGYNNKQFTGSSAFATSLITTTAGTVYIVFRPRAANNNQNASNRHNNNHIYRFGNTYLTLSSTGIVRPVYRNGSTNVETAHTISFGTWYMLEIRHDGTDLTSLISDSATPQTAAVASWSSNTTVVVSGSGSQGFDGEIAEVVTYNTSLGVNDRQAVRDYLSTKYGLSWA